VEATTEKRIAIRVPASLFDLIEQERRRIKKETGSLPSMSQVVREVLGTCLQARKTLRGVP